MAADFSATTPFHAKLCLAALHTASMIIVALSTDSRAHADPTSVHDHNDDDHHVTATNYHLHYIMGLNLTGVGGGGNRSAASVAAVSAAAAAQVVARTYAGLPVIHSLMGTTMFACLPIIFTIFVCSAIMLPSFLTPTKHRKQVFNLITPTICYATVCVYACALLLAFVAPPPHCAVTKSRRHVQQQCSAPPQTVVAVPPGQQQQATQTRSSSSLGMRDLLFSPHEWVFALITNSLVFPVADDAGGGGASSVTGGGGDAGALRKSAAMRDHENGAAATQTVHRVTASSSFVQQCPDPLLFAASAACMSNTVVNGARYRILVTVFALHAAMHTVVQLQTALQTFLVDVRKCSSGQFVFGGGTLSACTVCLYCFAALSPGTSADVCHVLQDIVLMHALMIFTPEMVGTVFKVSLQTLRKLLD